MIIYLLLKTITASNINAAPNMSNIPNVDPNSKNENTIAAIGSRHPIILPLTAPINLTPSRYKLNEAIVPISTIPLIHKKSI